MGSHCSDDSVACGLQGILPLPLPLLQVSRKMCGLTGHGMNRDANSGRCGRVSGCAVWWTRLISWVVLLECMLGAGLSHAQQAPAPLPEVSLAAGPVTERTGAVSERTGVASSSVTSVIGGTDAVFTLERTGATSEALAVMVRLSETGSVPN